MNNLTDAEISRRLALAIGWNPKDVRITTEFGFQVAANPPRSCYTSDPWWRNFDYRDPAVIWPIAERFDAFPARIGDGWDAYIPDTDKYTRSDTAAKAVALAVIKSKEVK